MQIALNQDEFELVFTFTDTDGNGTVEYAEFISKLQRSGVEIRTPEEEHLYKFVQHIKEAGYHSIRDAFDDFDESKLIIKNFERQ